MNVAIDLVTISSPNHYQLQLVDSTICVTSNNGDDISSHSSDTVMILSNTSQLIQNILLFGTDTDKFLRYSQLQELFSRDNIGRDTLAMINECKADVSAA
jgi:hypothetical protein